MTTFRWIAVVAGVAWCGAVAGGALAADTKQAKTDIKVAAPAEGKININGATQTELMKLEGVGAGTAKKIIAWREAHGPFKHAHDLEKVPGVGREVFGKNHGRIAVK
jgi:competence ComEA-like helix-hairpin-helix protein